MVTCRIFDDRSTDNKPLTSKNNYVLKKGSNNIIIKIWELTNKSLVNIYEEIFTNDIILENGNEDFCDDNVSMMFWVTSKTENDYYTIKIRYN